MFDHHRRKAFSVFLNVPRGVERVKYLPCNGTAQFVFLRSGWTESHQFEILSDQSNFGIPPSTILQQQQSETCLHPLKERRLKLKISLFRNDKLCREIGILLDAKLCGTQTREGEYLNMSNSTQLHMKNLPVSNLDVKLITHSG